MTFLAEPRILMLKCGSLNSFLPVWMGTRIMLLVFIALSLLLAVWKLKHVTLLIISVRVTIFLIANMFSPYWLSRSCLSTVPGKRSMRPIDNEYRCQVLHETHAQVVSLPPLLTPSLLNSAAASVRMSLCDDVTKPNIAQLHPTRSLGAEALTCAGKMGGNVLNT